MTTAERKKPRIDSARSAQMALIRGKDTKPEMIVRTLVDLLGLKYLTHVAHLPGQPDLCFPRRKKAIFVHGCFWHQHQSLTCWRSRFPKTRREFWIPKLKANQIRDRKQISELRENGWKSLVIWECQTIKSKQSALTKRIQRFLAS
jgi:DNA mismatch endonuclease, patch repair protein